MMHVFPFVFGGVCVVCAWVVRRWIGREYDRQMEQIREAYRWME